MNSPESNILTPPRPKPLILQSTFSKRKDRIYPQIDLRPKLQPQKAFVLHRINSIFDQGPRVKFISFKENFIEPINPFYDSSNKKLYIAQCFELKKKLGSGLFGDVYKVLSKMDQKYYAVKKMKYISIGDRSRKLKEVEKQEIIPEHKNLVKFIMAWEEKRHLYMITELCKISLCDYAEKCHNISEENIWNYMIDLLQGLKHLHSHDLIHMDIKPANIFISYDDICKIGDFGLVLNINMKDELYDATDGDPKYLAAEVLQGQYTQAADIFSLGITILELAIDLDLPTGNDLWHLLRSGELPEDMLLDISDDLKTIIQCMMNPEPSKRKTAFELLENDISKEHFKRALNREINKNEFINYEDQSMDSQTSLNLIGKEEEEISCIEYKSLNENLFFSSPSSDEAFPNNFSPKSNKRCATTPRRRGDNNPLRYSTSSSDPSFNERLIDSPIFHSIKADLFGSKMRKLTYTAEEIDLKDNFLPQNLCKIFCEMENEDDL